MTPKYCKDCQFVMRDTMPTPRGLQLTYVCSNINCSDPVDASPIICGIARREATLCGFQGKYYQQAKPSADAPKDNIIQLETK